MRSKLVTLGFFLILFAGLRAQSFNFNCTRDTVILGCSSGACITLTAIIPDLQGTTTSYYVNPTSTLPGCFPVYTRPDDPAGAATNLVIDDRYSGVIDIGFPFPFYGAVYNSLVASTNGFLTFDLSRTGLFSHYNIINGGNPQNLPSTFYNKALIMGPYHDLDPSVPNSPSQRIQYQTIGTAPHRKWILSYYKVPLYSTACNSLIENTHQIILYESTGIIEVTIFDMQICNGWNQGRAMIGLQNFNQNQGIMVPGRYASDPPWGSPGMNESWRFVPANGSSLFIRAEIVDLSGNIIAMGSITNSVNGQLEIAFSNICAPAGVITPYIIRSVYSKIDDPSVEIYGTDTVRVNRTNAVLNANAASTATSCSNSADGTIIITNANGVPPYTFILDGGQPVTGTVPFTFNSVTAGNHILVVSESSGCIMSLPVTVAAGPPFTTTISKTDALCHSGNTGTITVQQPSSGSSPFEYSLDGVTWQAANVFTGLVAGTYTVYFRESNGCSGSQQVTINEPPALQAAIVTTPVVCNGQPNGIITVNASGGTAPFQYALDGSAFQNNNSFQVPAGDYTVTIQDGNNCTATLTVNVSEPAALQLNVTPQNASCDGGNDGKIIITVAGGNPGYRYSLDSLNFQASPVFNVAPGNFSVMVKDSKGCTSSQQVTVGLNNNLFITPPADKIICEGTSAGLQVISNATQYAWSPATGLSNTTVSNPIANPAVTTQYQVTVTLGRCTATESLTVKVNTAPVPDAGPDGYICYGQNFRLQGSGGVGFHWSPSTYLNNSALAHPLTTPAKTIRYTLTVTDSNGCHSLVSDNVTVDVTPPIVVSTFPRDTIVYQGDQFPVMAISVADKYSWFPYTGLSNPGIPNPIVNAGDIGEVVTYKVTASTMAGCKGEGFIKVQVYKGPDLYMPTGFTPNGDGKNDRFTPFPVGIKQLNYFKVFSRWGQLLYSTSTLLEGWDGKLGGKEMPDGVYVWMAEGVTKQDKKITKKGTVTLIR